MAASPQTAVAAATSSRIVPPRAAPAPRRGRQPERRGREEERVQAVRESHPVELLVRPGDTRPSSSGPGRGRICRRQPRRWSWANCGPAWDVYFLLFRAMSSWGNTSSAETRGSEWVIERAKGLRRGGRALPLWLPSSFWSSALSRRSAPSYAASGGAHALRTVAHAATGQKVVVRHSSASSQYGDVLGDQDDEEACHASQSRPGRSGQVGNASVHGHFAARDGAAQPRARSRRVFPPPRGSQRDVRRLTTDRWSRAHPRPAPHAA